uniref:Uncharacterized protein n=1 Tax=Picea sitchensis TaxID=3332 RepID=A9NPN6_PICSI|nr:unknown [Picea sitchensis]
MCRRLNPQILHQSLSIWVFSLPDDTLNQHTVYIQWHRFVVCQIDLVLRV